MLSIWFGKSFLSFNVMLNMLMGQQQRKLIIKLNEHIKQNFNMALFSRTFHMIFWWLLSEKIVLCKYILGLLRNHKCKSGGIQRGMLTHFKNWFIFLSVKERTSVSETHFDSSRHIVLKLSLLALDFSDLRSLFSVLFCQFNFVTKLNRDKL